MAFSPLRNSQKTPNRPVSFCLLKKPQTTNHNIRELAAGRRFTGTMPVILQSPAQQRIPNHFAINHKILAANSSQKARFPTCRNKIRKKAISVVIGCQSQTFLPHKSLHAGLESQGNLALSFSFLLHSLTMKGNKPQSTQACLRTTNHKHYAQLTSHRSRNTHPLTYQS